MNKKENQSGKSYDENIENLECILNTYRQCNIGIRTLYELLTLRRLKGISRNVFTNEIIIEKYNEKEVIYLFKKEYGGDNANYNDSFNNVNFNHYINYILSYSSNEFAELSHISLDCDHIEFKFNNQLAILKVNGPYNAYPILKPESRNSFKNEERLSFMIKVNNMEVVLSQFDFIEFLKFNNIKSVKSFNDTFIIQ